jgi:hypothetical protein
MMLLSCRSGWSTVAVEARRTSEIVDACCGVRVASRLAGYSDGSSVKMDIPRGPTFTDRISADVRMTHDLRCG